MTTAQKVYWWVAINGPTVPASLLVATPKPRVIPTPEVLIGLPTREEAAATQAFLLSAPIPECEKKLTALQARSDVAYFKYRNPGRPDPSLPTMWLARDEDKHSPAAMQDGSVRTAVLTDLARRKN